MHSNKEKTDIAQSPVCWGYAKNSLHIWNELAASM